MLGPPIDFANRRKSSDIKKKKRKDENGSFELEALHNNLTVIVGR